jgi:hypothetical protein
MQNWEIYSNFIKDIQVRIPNLNQNSLEDLEGDFVTAPIRSL